jgi:hypothetical protein
MTKTGGSWFYILHPIAMLTIMVGAMAGFYLPARMSPTDNVRQKTSLLLALLVLANLVLGGIGARYIILWYQWHARDYRSIEEPLRALIPKGSIILGVPEVWYAAEKTGASLRLRGEPDPQLHDFVITKVKDSISTLPGFRKIAEIGDPFPAIAGRYRVSPADYQLVIWEADRRIGNVIRFTRFVRE